MMLIPKKISWNHGVAYAAGLMASDGCLHKDGMRTWISSKDTEILHHFKKALHLKNKIGCYARGGETEKRYYYLSLSRRDIYTFFAHIGLTPAKSKTIGPLLIPKKYFSDFTRGLFDGDGTFYDYWDKRWPASYCYKLSFASASRKFLEWLKMELSNKLNTKGYFHKGAGVINLEYTKGDTTKIYLFMYGRPNKGLFLQRKYLKVKSALEKNALLKLKGNAVVAQW